MGRIPTHTWILSSFSEQRPYILPSPPLQFTCPAIHLLIYPSIYLCITSWICPPPSLSLLVFLAVASLLCSTLLFLSRRIEDPYAILLREQSTRTGLPDLGLLSLMRRRYYLLSVCLSVRLSLTAYGSTVAVCSAACLRVQSIFQLSDQSVSQSASNSIQGKWEIHSKESERTILKSQVKSTLIQFDLITDTADMDMDMNMVAYSMLVGLLNQMSSSAPSFPNLPFLSFLTSISLTSFHLSSFILSPIVISISALHTA